MRLAVVVELAPDWHVNSHTPSQKYLIPTELVLEAAEGLNISGVIGSGQPCDTGQIAAGLFTCAGGTTCMDPGTGFVCQ